MIPETLRRLVVKVISLKYSCYYIARMNFILKILIISTLIIFSMILLQKWIRNETKAAENESTFFIKGN